MPTKSEQLTVGMLKSLLADLPDDTFVIVEGCDCVGEAVGVEIWSTYEGSIVITRR